MFFISALDLDTALAVLRVSAKFSPNRYLSIFELVICDLTSFFSTDELNILLVTESECCMSHNNLFASISFFNNSLFWLLGSSSDEVAEAIQEIAEARSFCFASIALSRAINVSGKAALISKFIAGAPKRIPLEGNKYF